MADGIRALLDLPVEIRLAIYEICIQDYAESQESDHGPDPTEQPMAPAITRTCRTTRAESLPIWYARARFPIRFRPSKQAPQKRIGGTPEYDFVLSHPPLAYQQMRKLLLCFTQSYSMNASYYCYAVDLDERQNSYTIEHTPRTQNWWVGYRSWNVQAHKKAAWRAIVLRKRFDVAVAEMIAQSGGVRNLTVESFERLVPRTEWKFGEDIVVEGES